MEKKIYLSIKQLCDIRTQKSQLDIIYCLTHNLIATKVRESILLRIFMHRIGFTSTVYPNIAIFFTYTHA